MKRYYLDHNASSPMPIEVREHIATQLVSESLNPGSTHFEGRKAKRILEGARRSLVRGCGGCHGALFFTSGATESNNTVLAHWASRGHAVATSRLEHPSVHDTLHKLGASLHLIGHDERGDLELGQLEELLNRGVKHVSLILANNETGGLLQLDETLALCERHGAWLHLDAAQWCGRWTFEIPPFLGSLTMSAHKCGGPPGVGALWVNDSNPLAPLIHGGHQEREQRAGTENVLFASAMAKAHEIGPSRWHGLAGTRDALESLLCEKLGFEPNPVGMARMENTMSLRLPGRASEETLQVLDLEGVSVSAGSACTAGSVDPSRVIQELTGSKQHAQETLRLSLGPEVGEEDVAEIFSVFASALS